MRKLFILATIAATASSFAYMPVYSADIDSLALGAVDGTNGITSLVGNGGYDATVIGDTTGAGRGQILKLSTPLPTDDTGASIRRMSGAIFSWDTAGGPNDLVAPGFTSIRVKFDVFVEPNNYQNLYFTNSNRDTNFAQTINDGKWLGFGSKTPNGSILGQTWWSVTLDWDKVAGTRAGTITDGVNVYNTNAADLNIVNDGAVPGFYRFNIRTITDNRPGGPASQWYVDNFKVEAVPEPATMTALAMGALALMRRRRNR